MPGSTTQGISDYPEGQLNNRAYLLRLMQTGRGRDRKMAERRLDDLDRQEQLNLTRQQNRDTFNERQQQREDFYYDKAQQSREARDVTSADQAVRNKALQQNADTQRMQTLQYMLADPNFSSQHEGIRAEIARMSGVGGTMPTQNPNAKKGEYGPGGAPATAPATNQPTTGYNPPTGTFAFESPPVGPPGTSDVDRVNQLKATGQGYMEGGRVVGGPPGYDFNTNTGEWIPSGQQGTINGVPSGQYLAQHARGVSPESPSGQAAFAAMNNANAVAGGNPPPKEAGAYPGAPPFVPPTAAFTQPGAVAPSATQYTAPAGPPIGVPPAPIQFGFEGQPPINVGTVGLNSNVPSNQAQDEAARRAAGLPPPRFRF